MDDMPAIVMVTAMGQESFVQKAIVNGAKGFIVKPYKPEAVLKQLSKFKN